MTFGKGLLLQEYDDSRVLGPQRGGAGNTVAHNPDYERLDVRALHSHGSFPQPMQRPDALRFLALRMDGVSETNFAQCL